jgi:hypothetical protein
LVMPTQGRKSLIRYLRRTQVQLFQVSQGSALSEKS